MNHIAERRREERINVRCEIFCKLQGSKEVHEAVCVTLTSGGVSLVCSSPFEVASAVEVSIIEESAMPALDFLISVVRCRAIENGNFEIGGTLHLPDEAIEE